MSGNNKIVDTNWIAEDVKEIWFKNHDIARKFKPGQFIIVRQDEKSERIPLTVVETREDVIRIIIQIVGYSSDRLCKMDKGSVIESVVGPLGLPSQLKKFGDVICIAGGIGAAPLKPVARELKELNNKLTIIEGARCKKYLILEDELEELADDFILMSDDGSFGEKGLVTKPFRKIVESGRIPDFVFAVGPPVMMKAVSKITSQYNVPLTVSLNPIMVDGTGMCGACRVEVGGETKFACVDGPEFDGNAVNFELLMHRLRIYKNEEELSKSGSECSCNGKNGS